MKIIGKTMLVATLVAFIGWLFSVFLTECFFTGSSAEIGAVFSWGIYLSVVIIFSTAFIANKISNNSK